MNSSADPHGRRDSGRSKALLRSALSACTLLLSGCISLDPSLPEPPLPVSSAYDEDAPTTSGTNSLDAAATGWKDYFADPRLQALIGQALLNNRDLRSALLRVEEAQAAYGIQKAAQYPAISLGAAELRTRMPGSELTGGQGLTFTDYSVSLSELAWEVDLWGRVRSLKKSALERYLASAAAQRAVALSLVEQVANGYLHLRELDERLALAQQTVSSRNESLRIFRRRVEVGSTSRLELTQVETLLSQAQLLQSQLGQERAAQSHALIQLIGAPVDLSPLDEPAGDDEILPELRTGLPSDLLTLRPDIIAAEHQLQAANSDVGAARAAFFPQITLTGAFGSSSDQLNQLFQGPSRSWTFLPSVSLPVLDGGRNRAGLDQAKVRSTLAVANYEKTVQTAFREVSDALSSRHWLGEQVHIEQKALDTQTERARLAQLRYDSGAASFLEVLDAQRDLLVTQQQLVQVRRALLSSQVSLYAALGGGMQKSLPGPPPRSPSGTQAQTP